MNFRAFYILAISILVFGACTSGTPTPGTAQSQKKSGIIEGTKAASSDPVAQATVFVDTPSGQCTGVLLSDDVVLTAAHCFDLDPAGFEGTTVTIRSGDLTLECTKAEASEIAHTPEAKLVAGVHQPDIALLKLKTKVCKTVETALGSEVKTDDTVTIAGYGVGTTGDQPDTIDLRLILRDRATINELNSDLDPTIEEEAEQINSMNEYYDIMALYLFAVPVQSGQSMCGGDSGGPVFQMKDGILNIVGVNGAVLPNSKKGTPKCRNAFFQIFTPVAPYASWIESKIVRW